MKASGKNSEIGWNWFWYLPVCLLVLFMVEGHTILFAARVLKLAFHRWSWGILFSPAAYFCWSTVIASVIVPINGLMLALTPLSKQLDLNTSRRYIYIAGVVIAIFLVPVVTDTLIWGSFPVTFDNAGIGRLRMIPFLPWPSGGYLTF